MHRMFIHFLMRHTLISKRRLYGIWLCTIIWDIGVVICHLNIFTFLSSKSQNKPNEFMLIQSLYPQYCMKYVMVYQYVDFIMIYGNVGVVFLRFISLNIFRLRSFNGLLTHCGCAFVFLMVIKMLLFLHLLQYKSYFLEKLHMISHFHSFARTCALNQAASIKMTWKLDFGRNLE